VREDGKLMRIAFLTNEYPPHIYGGAGVHAEYLSHELARLDRGKHKINIFCFGNQKEHSANETVEGIHLDFDFPFQDSRHQKLFDTLFRNIITTGSVKEPEIVHCHTWYTHLAGCLIKQIFSIPLVITTHSLEPQRPWKEEQLGSAYKASTWLERTAYENADGVIAVSQSIKLAVHNLYKVPFEKICVIHNAIDVNQYKPTFNTALLTSYKINPDKPYLLFVGRITRQKGIIHLVNAVKYFSPGIQVVLCAGAPDTEDMGREMLEMVNKARKNTSNEIIWINTLVPRNHLICLYSHASVFVCPSIYEPFGLINLEAMACGTPVVSSAVGGIPEVVVPDENGLLVSFEPKNSDDCEPKDPEKFSRDLASAINNLFLSPEKIKIMGIKSRKRVEKHFTWQGVAQRTLDFYKELIKKRKKFSDVHPSTTLCTDKNQNRDNYSV
jgi:starch synthase